MPIRKGLSTSAESQVVGTGDYKRRKLQETSTWPSELDPDEKPESKPDFDKSSGQVAKACISKLDRIRAGVEDPSSSDDSGERTSSTHSSDSRRETSSQDRIKPQLFLHILRQADDLHMHTTPQHLGEDFLILSKETKRNRLGSGSYGKVHSVKVIDCGLNVKRRLVELSLLSAPRSKKAGVPKTCRVALKTLAWAKEQCTCFPCILQLERPKELKDSRNAERVRRNLGRVSGVASEDFIECETTASLQNEITALRTLIGLRGAQQIIGYEMYSSGTTGKLVSTYNYPSRNACAVSIKRKEVGLISTVGSTIGREISSQSSAKLSSLVRFHISW